MNDTPPPGLSAPRPELYPAAQAIATKPRPDAAPSVAIITRTKNRTLLLHRALSSVLLQRYTNWHLFVVNDGGDPAAIEAMLPHYLPVFEGRLTVIHHAESQGMERASNAALSRATQDLVVVHDDDDAWHPDFLEAAVGFLASPANRHYVGVATGCVVVRERIEGEEVREVERETWLLGRRIIDFRRILVENQFPPICLVFRRSAVDLVGGYNGELPVLGDWEFNLRLLLLGDIGYVERPLAYYHHRVKGTLSAYGNTVIDGHTIHEALNVRLRNGMLRAALTERPEMIGLLQPLLHAIHEGGTNGHANSRLDRLDRLDQIAADLEELRGWIVEVRMVASWQRKMLRPFQRVYAGLRRVLRR